MDMLIDLIPKSMVGEIKQISVSSFIDFHNGHVNRYVDNIKLVDANIAKFMKSFEKFYNNDGKTAYIFTADHGMSNRGECNDTV